MAPAQKKFKLNSGDEIPAIGLGTWVSKTRRSHKSLIPATSEEIPSEVTSRQAAEIIPRGRVI